MSECSMVRNLSWKRKYPPFLAPTSFQLADLIVNDGEDEQEFQIIYHANFGPPLLEEGSTFAGGGREGHPVQRSMPPKMSHLTRTIRGHAWDSSSRSIVFVRSRTARDAP